MQAVVLLVVIVAGAAIYLVSIIRSGINSGVAEWERISRLRRLDRLWIEAETADKGFERPARVSRLEQAAYHEAGHLVVASALGVPIRGAIASADGSGRAMLDLQRWVEDEAGQERLVGAMLVLAAGPIAEAKLACCNIDESLAHARTDLNNAVGTVELMLGVELTLAQQRAVLSPVAKAAMILLYECRDVLERITRILVANGQATAAEIASLTAPSLEIHRAQQRVSRAEWTADITYLLQIAVSMPSEPQR